MKSESFFRRILKPLLAAVLLFVAAALPAVSQDVRWIGATRDSFQGARLDLRADFGAACNGSTNDTAALTAAVTKANAASPPITITFPGTCMITAQTYTFTAAASLEGIDGGGVKLIGGGAPTGNILYWNIGSGNVAVRNMVIDGNTVALASGNGGLVRIDGATEIRVTGNRIINVAAPISTTHAYGVWLNNSPLAIVEGNYIAFAAASIYTNQALQLNGVTTSTISNNFFINSGSAMYGGTGGFTTTAGKMTFTGNVTKGWAFGGGITFEITGQDIEDRGSVISGNSFYDSGTALDINTTNIPAIEVGFTGVQIIGNKIRGTCGPGIFVYGRASIVGNTIVNAGTCNSSTYYNSGIAVGNPGGQPAGANYTWIDNNVVYDDGGGNTTYGFSDTNSSTGVKLGVNDFNGSQGAYNIVGLTQFASPQPDNRVVNACGAVDQRNEGASIGSGKSADQWQVTASQGGVNVNSGTFVMYPCTSGMQATVSSSHAPLTGDYQFLFQNIAIGDLRDLGYGTVAPRDLVFSFIAKTSLSPPNTFSAALINANSVYSYAVNYTITAAANTAQTFSFRVPADSHSIGPVNTNVGMKVVFDLGSGATNKTTAGSWQSGNFYGVTGSTNLIAQANATTLVITGVRLLPAGADQGWAPRTFSDELERSRRFYRKSFPIGTVPAQNAGLTGAACAAAQAAGARPMLTLQFGKPMLLTPTITTFNPSAANANWRDVTAVADVAAVVLTNGRGPLGATIGASAGSATAGNENCIHYTAEGGL